MTTACRRSWVTCCTRWSSASPLHIHVLNWDYAMLYALEREWMMARKPGRPRNKRLHFRTDARHPVGASHHQKIVVIDDKLAFVGGLDLTRCRWDTPEHLPEHPLRRDPDDKPYAPFHDVQAMVDGDAARALANWHGAAGAWPAMPNAVR
jgi:phosphatidylserine/phosphatidylglycerophosphate/cardiolipin synthase-like enzyme